ncbi:MAG: hypothetical protein RPU32_11405 [Candidatus Sedimenticola sp. (ex Thyasira tokunagai)]
MLKSRRLSGCRLTLCTMALLSTGCSQPPPDDSQSEVAQRKDIEQEVLSQTRELIKYIDAEELLYQEQLRAQSRGNSTK